MIALKSIQRKRRAYDRIVKRKTSVADKARSSGRSSELHCPLIAAMRARKASRRCRFEQAPALGREAPPSLG